MLYLKYVAESVGLIIFIFSYLVLQTGKSGMGWGRDLSDFTEVAQKCVFYG